ncbi:MAG: hypothetical protein ABIN36_12455 [Ferruginibacter sp.]
MKIIIVLFVWINILLLFGCENTAPVSKHRSTVDMKMLDSIRKNSDSTYSELYGRNDFVTAEYFISKKDSTTTQVMSDSSKIIRQVIIAKNKRRIYFTQFYANGQLMFKNHLDDYGQFNGESSSFYESGRLKRTGIYKNGFYHGNWKNYDENGKYISTDEYDGNGQEVNSE